MKTKDARFLATALVILCSMALGTTGPRADEEIHPVPVTATVVKTPPDYVPPPPATSPEVLPALSGGQLVHIKLALIDKTVDIGGGRKYQAWSFNGTVPGPVLHARVGDTLDVELTNTATMGHSIDFHAELGPNQVAYQTIAPGETLHFKVLVYYPGVFLYHCGSEPVLLHIANGMMVH